MTSEDTKSDDLKKIGWNPFIYIGLIVVLLWIASWIFTGFYFDKWEERGTFGDMFGAINSLFSGLALAGVVYAIFLQQNELELQRKELRDTRQELKGSREAQERSEKALADQVQQMERAAILNAYGSLATTYSTLYSAATHSDWQKNALEPVRHLKEMLAEIEREYHEKKEAKKQN